MKKLLLLAVLLIPVFGFGQTHTFCPEDGNCTWTGAQKFSGEPFISALMICDGDSANAAANTTAAQAASTQAAIKGGRILMPPGDCYVNGTAFTIPSSTNLAGAGSDFTNSSLSTGSGTRLIQLSTTADTIKIIPTGTGAYRNAIALEGFTVIGAGSGVTTGNCLHIGNGNGLSTDLTMFIDINNVNLANCKDNALYIEGSTNTTAAPFRITLRNSRLQFSGGGIKTSGWVEQVYGYNLWVAANLAYDFSIAGGTQGQTDFYFDKVSLLPGSIAQAAQHPSVVINNANNVTFHDPYFDHGYTKMISLSGAVNNFKLTGNSHIAQAEQTSQTGAAQGVVYESGMTCNGCSFDNQGWNNTSTTKMFTVADNTVHISNSTYGYKAVSGQPTQPITLEGDFVWTAALPGGDGSTFSASNRFLGKRNLATGDQNVDEVVPTAGLTGSIQADVVAQINQCMTGGGISTNRCIIPFNYGVVTISNLICATGTCTVTTSTAHGFVNGNKATMLMYSPTAADCTGCAVTVIDSTHFTYSNSASFSGTPVTGTAMRAVADASAFGVGTKVLVDRRAMGERIFTSGIGPTAPVYYETDPTFFKPSFPNLAYAYVSSGMVGDYVAKFTNTASGTGNNGVFIQCTDTNTATLGLNVQVGVTSIFRVFCDQHLGLGANVSITPGGQIQSIVSTGTAPFSVASTTNVANLNASSLNGATFAAPGAIGGGTPAAGTFTALTAATYNTSTNCASSAGTCVAAAAGRVSIAAAATTVTVATTAVTANSEIFIQEDSTLGTALSVTCNTTTGRTYTVTTRTAATSFVITASAAPTTNPACLSYRIVN
jgi:hypothetical protein